LEAEATAAEGSGVAGLDWEAMGLAAAETVAEAEAMAAAMAAAGSEEVGSDWEAADLAVAVAVTGVAHRAIAQSLCRCGCRSAA
jgi:hypothetical protein